MKISACQGLVTLLVLLLLGLAVIIFGQRTMMIRLSKDTENIDQRMRDLLSNVKLEKQNVELKEETVKSSVTKTQKDKAALDGLIIDNQKKVAEREACEKVQNTLTVEMEALQKERTTQEEQFNGSKTEWSNEIDKLVQQLEQPSPACPYVKKSTESAKLCPSLAANSSAIPSKEDTKKV